MFAALLAAPAAPLLDLAGAVPVLLHLGLWVRALGLGLMVVGTAVVASAQLQMGNSWRVGIDETEATDLVTHGLYRYARNPIYTGMLLRSPASRSRSPTSPPSSRWPSPCSGWRRACASSETPGARTTTR